MENTVRFMDNKKKTCMYIFVTNIYIKGIKFRGPRISAISWDDAAYQAKRQGLELVGKLIMDVPCDDNFTPDWLKAIDYDLKVQN